MVTEPATLPMRELLTWVAARRRTCAEAMELWRCNGPRHPVRDDGVADGLVEVASGTWLPQAEVRLTARGQAMLNEGTG